MPEGRERLADGIRYQRGGELDRALDAFAAGAESTDPAVAAEALRRRGKVLRTRCDWDGALRDVRRSAEIARDAGLTEHLAEALNGEALVWQSRGEFASASPLYEEILLLTADQRIRGLAHENLGSIAAIHGDYRTASRRFLLAYRCFRRSDYAEGVARVLNNYGRSLLEGGQWERGEEVLERAAAAAREFGDLDLVQVIAVNRAESRLLRGRLDEAEKDLSAALGYFSNAGNTWRVVECLRVLGDVAVKRGDLETARRFFERGLDMATDLGTRVEAEQLRDRLQSLPAAP